MTGMFHMPLKECFVDFDNRPIGVFDSGFGGLTVARELVKRLPEENIIYYGDTARMARVTPKRFVRSFLISVHG